MLISRRDEVVTKANARILKNGKDADYQEGGWLEDGPQVRAAQVRVRRVLQGHHQLDRLDRLTDRYIIYGNAY